MYNLIIASILFLLTVLNVGCSSLLTVKDFNKIEVGMTKNQVIAELGEPKTTKTLDGREVLVYDAEDGNETKLRWVVLEDKEVIFFGRPGEYKGKDEGRSPAGASNTVTVSPNINPVISPVFNFNGSPASNVPQIQPQAGERLLWFHANPGNETKE